MLKLREERLKHGYTLKQIGSMIGVSEASVSLYETGKREPSNETLTFFADLYGVSVDYLLGRDTNTNEQLSSEMDFDDEDELDAEMKRVFFSAPDHIKRASIDFIKFQLRNNDK